MTFLKSLVKKVVIVGAPVATYYIGLKNSEDSHHQYDELLARSSDHRAPEVALYTFPPSMYTHKVLAYLDYHGTPYTNVVVNPLTKEQILFSKDYKMIPIALIGGEQVNDSTKILETLAKRSYSRTDTAAMKIVNDEVIPALYATLFDSFDNLNAFGASQPILFRALITMMSPLMAYKSKNKYGDAYDTERLLPALTSAFNTVGNYSTPLPSELALFGALKVMHDVDAVQDTLAACNRTAWFEKLEAECAKRSQANMA